MLNLKFFRGIKYNHHFCLRHKTKKNFITFRLWFPVTFSYSFKRKCPSVDRQGMNGSMWNDLTCMSRRTSASKREIEKIKKHTHTHRHTQKSVKSEESATTPRDRFTVNKGRVSPREREDPMMHMRLDDSWERVFVGIWLYRLFCFPTFALSWSRGAVNYVPISADRRGISSWNARSPSNRYIFYSRPTRSCRNYNWFNGLTTFLKIVKLFGYCIRDYCKWQFYCFP